MRVGPDLLVVVRSGAAAHVVALLLPARAAVLRTPETALAAAELSVRRVAATAESLMAQFAPRQMGGLALVVPRRSQAFRAARSTKCLPAFMPNETSTGELSYVSGSGSVQSHSLGRPDADVIRDAGTCAAIAMGLQLATASVTAALCDFRTSLDDDVVGTPAVRSEGSSKRLRTEAPQSQDCG